MFRFICNYMRQCACKHEFEYLTQVTTHSDFGEVTHHQTYRCRK